MFEQLGSIKPETPVLGGYRNVLPEQPWSGTSLLRGVDAGQVCAAVCGPGRLYWNGPSLLFTGHLVTLNIYTTPIHHPHLCAPARGRHHRQPISNIINIQALKTIFCAFRFPRSFLTASQAQAQTQGRNQKRRYENQKINHCRDFCLQLNDVPILAEKFANTKHLTVKLYF